MNEEVSISYLESGDSLVERRDQLRSQYLFDCGCELCIEEQRELVKRANMLHDTSSETASNSSSGDDVNADDISLDYEEQLLNMLIIRQLDDQLE